MPREPMVRPATLARLPLLLLGLDLPAQDRAQVFLEKCEALRAAFPDADRFLEWRRILSPDEILRLESGLQRVLPDGGYLVFLAFRQDQPVGLALITAEVGKVSPFAFLVATDLGLRVQRIDVMDYRESHGSEVRRRAFLDQFRGKTPGQPLRLAREVEGIPGATLSAHAVARGTRKALAVLAEWFPDRGAATLRAAFQAEGRELPAPRAWPEGPMAAQRPALGSVLAILAQASPGVDVGAAIEAGFVEAARLERILSRHQLDSAFSQMQREAGTRAVTVPAELASALAAALDAFHASGGAFDVTRGTGGPAAVRLDRDRRTVRLRDDRVQLDLDGCGKGYVVDRLVELLRARGVRAGRVGFRSSFRCFGPPADSSSWRVPLADGTVLELGDQACAVSSNDERPHVVDPVTSLPAAAGRDAVAVAPTAFEAEWLATAALVRGAAVGTGPGCQVRFVARAAPVK